MSTSLIHAIISANPATMLASRVRVTTDEHKVYLATALAFMIAALKASYLPLSIIHSTMRDCRIVGRSTTMHDCHACSLSYHAHILDHHTHLSTAILIYLCSITRLLY